MISGLHLRRWLVVGYVAFAVIVALVFAVQNHFAHRARERVEHTYLARERILSLFGKIKDVESAQRGYALTGDTAYLAPYREALRSHPDAGGAASRLAVSRSILEVIADLRALVADNPEQKRNVDSLEKLLWERLRYADTVIRQRRDGGLEAAVARVKTGHGRHIMEETRALVTVMLAEEDANLRSRAATANDRSSRNGKVLYFVVAFFFLLGLVLIWMAARSGQRRLKAERDLSESNALLKAMIDSSPFGILAADATGRMVVFNKAAERILGMTASSYLRRSAEALMRAMIAPEDIQTRAARVAEHLGREPQGVEAFTQALPEDPTHGLELSLVRNDGNRFPGLMAVSPIHGADGSELGAVSMISDLSELRRLEDDLRRSNALLNAVIHGTDYAVFVADQEGIIRIFSKGAERMLGYAAEDFVGRPVTEATRPLFLPEEIGARAARIAAQYGHPPVGVEIFNLPLADDGPYGQEWTNIKADGSRIRVAVSVWELTDSAGRPQGSVAIARDVTQVRKLEDEILRSNALFNAVINSTDQAIIAVDLEGTLILYNPAAERMEGYEASEFLGKHTSYNTRKTMLRHEIEARADKIRQEYGREAEDVEMFTLPLKDDPPGGVQWTFVRNGGQRYPVQMSVSEMRDAKGDTIGYMAVIRDITAFKTLESRLRESRARLQAVIDGIDYAIFAADADGILRLINRGTERILGYAVDNLVGRPVKEMAARFASPDELKARASRLAKHYGRLVSDMELISLPLPDDGPFGQEWTHTRPDGSAITLAFSVYSLQDDEGLPAGVVALARDVTELKALERMKNEFISTVSHELRTPLTSIRGALGLVAGGAVGAMPVGMREMIDIAYRNSVRLVHIINDILDIDKIESGQMNFFRKPVEVKTFLKAAMEANLPYGEKHGVRFVLGPTPGDAWMLADSDRLMQVMSNLLSNAAKFSPQNSEVTVAAEISGDKMRVTVRDHGAGISEKFRDRIFQKFAQAEGTDSRRHEGTGLGLNITKKLVEAMEGTIGFETEAGNGTTFWFELPLVKIAAAESAKDGRVSAAGDKVLICEDDPDVGSLLRLLLERAGLRADIERTLEGAKRRLGEGHYAAMTLDLILPDGSGLTWLRQLRSDPATQDFPVIVVSARAEEGRRELNGAAVGIIDWIAKPIDEHRLEAALKRAVRGGGRPRILHVEDDADFRRILANSLSGSAEWSGAATLGEAETLLNGGRFDLVVLDLDLPDGSGLDLLDRLKNAPGGPVPVLILSASETDNGVRHRVEAALVKSRLSEERIVETILAQIRNKGRQGDAPA